MRNITKILLALGLIGTAAVTTAAPSAAQVYYSGPGLSVYVGPPYYRHRYYGPRYYGRYTYYPRRHQYGSYGYYPRYRSYGYYPSPTYTW